MLDQSCTRLFLAFVARCWHQETCPCGRAGQGAQIGALQLSERQGKGEMKALNVLLLINCLLLKFVFLVGWRPCRLLKFEGTPEVGGGAGGFEHPPFEADEVHNVVTLNTRAC